MENQKKPHGGAGRGQGRKPAVPGEPRTKTLAVVVSPGEAEAVKATAAGLGLRVNEYIREKLGLS
jgi:hypothetical protein